ncbi:MAG: class I SAM-dependent methyltransferase [Candidatus Woesearchaeota archaeon]|nr:class I SAM-dependent methyltransferase [Candidatus Woesearchaeota archaeon]
MNKESLKKEIVHKIKQQMLRENKAYYCPRKPDYSLEIAKTQHDKITKKIIEHCKQNKFEKILDIGCGFGDLVFSLAKYGKQVYGIDVNEEFIKICDLKKDFLKQKNIEFINAPAEKIPFKNNNFDLVVSKTVLEHVEDVEKSISEMVRVTRKNGLIYIECPNYIWIKEGHFNVFMLPLMPKWLFRIWLRLLGKNPDFLSHIKYVTPSRIINSLKKRNVVCRNISEELISEILDGKSEAIKHTHKRIYDIIKTTRLLGLNKALLFLSKSFQAYPVTIIMGKK